MDDLVVIKTYFHKHDAEIAEGLLKDSGIEAIVSADDAGGFRPHLTFSMNNNRILVKKEDVEKAKEVLEVLEKETDVDLLKEYEKSVPAESEKKVELKSEESVKIGIKIFAGILIAAYTFLLVYDIEVDFRYYDSYFKEPFSTIYYLLTTPLDILVIFLSINLIRLQEWARKSMVLINGFVFLFVSINWFLPDSVVLLDLNNYDYPTNTWFDFIAYLILLSAPLMVLTRPNIKKQFSKEN